MPLPFPPPEKERLDQLRREIDRHNHLYHNLAAPEISDDRFDELVRTARAIEAAHPEWDSPDSPTHRVGAPAAARTKKNAFPPHRHAVPMLSIANSYSGDEIRKFAGRVEGALRDAGDRQPPRYVVELKIDGLAFAAFYEDGIFARGATRGDGETGEDVTTNLMAIHKLPKKLSAAAPSGEVEIRGEIYMPAEVFRRLVEEQEEEGGGRVFANPRNAAAGSLKLLDTAVVAGRGLECFFYQVVGAADYGLTGQAEALDSLEKWGLPVNPERAAVDSAAGILAFRDGMETRRRTLPYATDGLVVKLDSFRQQDILGLGTASPNWAVAYKFAPDRAETGVTDIRVQVGKLGRLTPVADLEPVLLAGSTITHASLHNESYIAEKDVRVGDRVLVEKAGEIIPQIHKVLAEKRTGGEKPYAMPTGCPSCGAESATTTSPGQDGRIVTLRFCRNPSCPAQQFARVVHFASRDAMDIEGMGPAAVEWLLRHDVIRDVADIYRLDAKTLLPMTKAGREILDEVGAGKTATPTKMAENLTSAIAASKKRGLGKLLFALAIPDIGETAAQVLAKRYKSLDALRAAGEEEVSAVPMGESTAYRTLGDKAAAVLAKRLAELPADERPRGGDADTLGLFLENLRLPGLGRKKCDAVARHFGGADKLLAAGVGEIAMAEMGASQVKRTLGPVAARSLRAYLNDAGNREVLRRLGDAGVALDETGGGGKVEGKVFVLTGTLPNLGRAEAKRIIEAAGGLVAGSVSQKVDYLVAGADPGSKLTKASELGVEVIDEAGLLKLCGHDKQG